MNLRGVAIVASCGRTSGPHRGIRMGSPRVTKFRSTGGRAYTSVEEVCSSARWSVRGIPAFLERSIPAGGSVRHGSPGTSAGSTGSGFRLVPLPAIGNAFEL